jgi:molybdopterin-guanine dinucleotide biosynthesis protein A
MRFGSPKALAEFDGVTLAERAWALLAEVCDERIAVGKRADGLPLPFELVDDGTAVRAPIAGLVAGLRVARHDIAIVIPVDMPRLDAASLRALADACRDVAVAQHGPLPGAYRAAALPVIERALVAGELSLRCAIEPLDVAEIEVEPEVLVNVNTPSDVQR